MLALWNTHGIGKEVLKQLLNIYDNDPELILESSDKELLRRHLLPKSFLEKIKLARKNIPKAQEEIQLLEDLNIHVISLHDSRYPYRLKRCEDAPSLIFAKGDCDLNPKYALSIVGTRNATEPGKTHCRKLVEGLVDFDPLIVSGLALGIDGCAHKSALEFQLKTAGVLGHGLDFIYPKQHKDLYKKIPLSHGILLSEYSHFTLPEKGFFAERNRIVAGLADAVIVVEAALKGGAHITAELASGYHRDVFAIPGRPEDIYSQGCNKLIKENKANLIENATDIIELLNWSSNKINQSRQTALHIQLEPEQELIFQSLQAHKDPLHIDKLSYACDILPAKLSGLLLELELMGIVRTLPGKRYELI